MKINHNKKTGRVTLDLTEREFSLLQETLADWIYASEAHDWTSWQDCKAVSKKIVVFKIQKF